jgi:hypothetical protein
MNIEDYPKKQAALQQRSVHCVRQAEYMGER